MVCLSCHLVVKYELEKLGIEHIVVTAGEVEILEPVSVLQIEQFKIALIKADMDLLEGTNRILTSKIIGIINKAIICPESVIRVSFSRYLSQELNLDYTYLANIFSATEGVCIEQFIINKRIDKVKQLISQNELTLTQIASELNYCNVAHLSTQFKKITGTTPSGYKQLHYTSR